MSDQTTLSFQKDVRPLFTDLDVAHMKPAGIDLSSRDSVEAHADAIYGTVTSGSMPPPNASEPRWTEAMCALFKQWQTEGYPP
jgi:uncharacterized membrane protein